MNNNIKAGDDCYYVKHLDIFFTANTYGDLEKAKKIIKLNNKENLKKHLEEEHLVKILNIRDDEASCYFYKLGMDSHEECSYEYDGYFYLHHFVAKEDIDEFIDIKLKESEKYHKEHIEYFREYYEWSKMVLEFMGEI